MLYVQFIKYVLKVFGIFFLVSGGVLAAGQFVVNATVVEDDDSVYPTFLYASGQLATTKEACIDSVIVGEYGYFFCDDSGSWAYITENKQTAIQRLGKGDQLTDSFTVSDVNGVLSSVRINIVGVNDAAVITGGSAAVVWEDRASRYGNLRASGSLVVNDVDSGETSFIDSSLVGRYGRLKINELGKWVYIARNGSPSIQGLAQGDFLTESFVVKSFDGTSHKLDVTIHGVNDLAQVEGVDVGTVTEDDDQQYEDFLYTSAKLEVIDDDLGEAGFIGDFIVGDYGYFFIDGQGDWEYLAINRSVAIQSLTNDEFLEDVFKVSTLDGTDHEVVIKILGVNEAGADGGINLSWSIPHLTANGKALSILDVAGYCVYYGNKSGEYALKKIVNDRDTDSLQLTGLGAGTYYIAMTAYDREGRESRLSNELVVTLK